MGNDNTSYDHNDNSPDHKPDGEFSSAEEMLWLKVLEDRQFYGYQFEHNHPVRGVMVTFVCRKLNLVIEIDHDSQNDGAGNENRSDEALADLGYTVVRFSESEIRHNLNKVIHVLEQYVPGGRTRQSLYPPFPIGL